MKYEEFDLDLVNSSPKSAAAVIAKMRRENEMLRSLLYLKFDRPAWDEVCDYFYENGGECADFAGSFWEHQEETDWKEIWLTKKTWHEAADLWIAESKKYLAIEEE